VPLSPDRRSRRELPLLAAASFLLVALSAGAREARADQAAELEAIKTRMQSGNYEEAERRLRRMLDPSSPPCPTTPDTTELGCQVTDPEILQKARGYYVNALVLNGKKDEARKPIYEILLQDPSFVPNPTLFIDKAVDLFNEERATHLAELVKKSQEDAAKIAKERAQQEEQKKERNAYIAALEARASVRVEKHSRWIAAIPFGVGQYQNDNVGWGLFFTVSEVLTAGASIVTTGVSYNLTLQGIGLQNWNGCLPLYDPPMAPVSKVCIAVPSISPAVKTELQTLEVVDDVSLGAFLVLAVSGVIEAQASFKPTVETKHPELLPPKPKVLVTGVPNAPSAFGAGLKVTF
jgi:Flp pilus assembly protein TadD